MDNLNNDDDKGSITEALPVVKNKGGRPKNPKDDKGRMLKELKKIWLNNKESVSNRCNAADLYAIIMGWKKQVSSDGSGAISSISFIPKISQQQRREASRQSEHSHMITKPLDMPPSNTQITVAPITKNEEATLQELSKPTTDNQECKEGYTQKDIDDFLQGIE